MSLKLALAAPDRYLLTRTGVGSSSSTTYSYADFVALDQQLRRELGAVKPPATLPAPRGWIGFLTLAPERDLVQALEDYLRTLVHHRDPRFAAARALGTFLDRATTTTTALPLTPAVWLQSHAALLQSSRECTLLGQRRDTLRERQNADWNAEDKKLKLALVAQSQGIEGLVTGLAELERAGMLQPELERRRALVASLMDGLENLARKGTVGPTAASSTRRNPGPSSSTTERRDLFSVPTGSGTTSRAPSRILGASAQSLETATTRPLDNASLLLAQSSYMDTQDTKLDSLAQLLRRQRVLGELINEELVGQGELLQGIERGVDRVEKGLGSAKKTLKKLG